MERRRETSCSPLQILARNSDVWEIVESIRGIEGGFWTLLAQGRGGGFVGAASKEGMRRR